MINIDLTNVEEAMDFKRVTEGGYIAKIMAVIDVADKQYLKIEYDIADGEFKDYYSDLFGSRGFWGGSFIRSYKQTALPFFKGFVTAIEDSNRNFKWNNDEQLFVDKQVGLVLGREEYTGLDGSTKERLYVDKICGVDKIKSGEFDIPQPKLLQSTQTTSGFTPITNDDDLPF